VFVPVDMARYQRVSAQIMRILGDFSPLVEQISVDEAFVDLTGTRALFGEPLDAVRAIKRRIQTETRLTASAGLAANKFVAKVASDLEKPDGLVAVPAGGEPAFLAPLGVERLWGVGRVTTRELAGLGIRTIGELQRLPPAVLRRRFGRLGGHLHDLAFGRDARAVTPDLDAKSIGAEHTFAVDSRDLARLERVLRGQAERVAAELRRAGLTAACVTLKLRFADFHTTTRRATGDPTQDGLQIFRRAKALLERERLVQSVRLIGVSASRLGAEGAGQLSLLDGAAVRRERLAHVVDALARRFGDGAVVPAALLDPARAGPDVGPR
jgi:DNA polymerase-4